MPTNIVFIDAESQSLLDVTRVGSQVYCKHPSTRPILWSVLPHDAPRALVFEDPDIFKVLALLRGSRTLKWGKKKNPLYVVFWSPFDRLLAQAWYERNGGQWPDDSDPTQAGVRGPDNTVWVDLSELALTTGLPIKLSVAAEFEGTDLKSPGKKLIELFCVPNDRGEFADPEDHPVEWEQFRQYCGQDTQALRPLFVRLTHNGVDPNFHAPRSWAIRRMNERGVPVDIDSTTYVVDRLDRAQAEAEREVFERYGFKTSQVKQAAAFLGLPNLQLPTVESAIESGQLDSDQLFVAEARVGLAGAARKKLKPLLLHSGPDGRVRGGFVYHGAVTGRLTSLGVQFQNFVRQPSDPAFFDKLRDIDPLDLFALTRHNIRGFLKAPAGRVFVAGDYSAIELRVGAWLAGELWLLEALRSGQDVYRVAAAARLGKDLADVTDEERQFYKAVELGCMFGLGPDGWIRQQAKKGLVVLRPEAERIVYADYRPSHPAFVEAWRHATEVFSRAVLRPRGHVTKAFGGRVLIQKHENCLTVRRPSGATQTFWMPTIVEGKWDDGSPRDEIQVFLKDDKSGYMVPSRTYGSKIFQGLVQGIAFDLMIEALGRCEYRGLCPVMSIHDEIVTEVEEDRAEDQEKLLRHELVNGRPWSDGIPVEVKMWTSQRFTAK